METPLNGLDPAGLDSTSPPLAPPLEEKLAQDSADPLYVPLKRVKKGKEKKKEKKGKKSRSRRSFGAPHKARPLKPQEKLMARKKADGEAAEVEPKFGIAVSEEVAKKVRKLRAQLELESGERSSMGQAVEHAVDQVLES